jgi:hypothetical protein
VPAPRGVIPADPGGPLAAVHLPLDSPHTEPSQLQWRDDINPRPTSLTWWSHLGARRRSISNLESGCTVSRWPKQPGASASWMQLKKRSAIKVKMILSCGIGSWGGRCPSLEGYVTGKGVHGRGDRRRRALMLPILTGASPDCRDRPTREDVHSGCRVFKVTASMMQAAFALALQQQLSTGSCAPSGAWGNRAGSMQEPALLAGRESIRALRRSWLLPRVEQGRPRGLGERGWPARRGEPARRR